MRRFGFTAHALYAFLLSASVRPTPYGAMLNDVFNGAFP